MAVEDTDDLADGVLGAVDHRERVIWLARNLPEAVRRCTLAYEIGRLERGPARGDPCVAAALDRCAAEWAARQLIPLPEMCMAYSAAAAGTGLRAAGIYAEMARMLEVDEATVRARLRALTNEEQDAVTDAVRGWPITV